MIKSLVFNGFGTLCPPPAAIDEFEFRKHEEC